MKQLVQKRIIGVAGEIAGGTTTFAKFTKKKYGAFETRYSIPLRDIIRIIQEHSLTATPFKNIAERLCLVPDENMLQTLYDCISREFGRGFALIMKEDRDTLQRLSTALRQTPEIGEDVLARTMIQDIQQSESGLIVVEGIRRIADIMSLRELPGFLFVYIEAAFEERYRRLRLRKQYDDEQNTTLEEFRRTCNQESEKQIRALKEHANIVIDTNPLHEESDESCLARYHQEIDKILRE